MEPFVFYAPSSAIDGDRISLSAAEGRHAVKVLRLKKGSLVIVVDGLGNAYRGAIEKMSRNGQVDVAIHSQTRNFGEPSVIVTLASGLSTGHKFDTVVEKGTELGVKRFVPLLTEKSAVKIEDPKRARTKLARYEKVALAAMKQCRRSYRPEISSPVDLYRYLDEIDAGSLTLLFHPNDRTEFLDDIELGPDLKRINLIVGPESGLSRNEVAAAAEKGARTVTLGRRILRTETAGPVVCALVMNKLGELR